MSTSVWSPGSSLPLTQSITWRGFRTSTHAADYYYLENVYADGDHGGHRVCSALK